MGKFGLLLLLVTVSAVCLGNEIEEPSRDKRDDNPPPPPVDESKDIRGGGGKSTAIVVTIIVVVLCVIVVVLVFYLVCYFCGNLCTRKSDGDDVEMTPRVRVATIEEDEIHESESAALLKQYSGQPVKDEPEKYDEYTLNEKGEKARPVEVDDNGKPPRLYPTVEGETSPGSEEKKPLYPNLEPGPGVTTATIENGKGAPTSPLDKPVVPPSLDEPDSLTHTKEPIVSTPSPAVLGAAPLIELAKVSAAPVARSAPVTREEPPESPREDRTPLYVPAERREVRDKPVKPVETNTRDRPVERNDTPTEEREKPRYVEEPAPSQPREKPKEVPPPDSIPRSILVPTKPLNGREDTPEKVEDLPEHVEELSPPREPEPAEPRREFSQPVRRAAPQPQPVIEDPPKEHDGHESPEVVHREKPIIVPVIAPKENEARPEQPRPAKEEPRPEDSPVREHKLEPREGREEPGRLPAVPVVTVTQPKAEDPNDEATSDEEETPEDEDKDKDKVLPVTRAEEPVTHRVEPSGEKPDTIDKPAVTPVVVVLPTETRESPPSETRESPPPETPNQEDRPETARVGKPADEPEKDNDEPEERRAERLPAGDSPEDSVPEEERHEPGLVICPPVPTNWEADETPLSPDYPTLPIRSPNTTENEIPTMASPSDPRERELDSSSPDSISLKSEDDVILNPSEEVPEHYPQSFGNGMAVPLADMDDDTDSMETESESETDPPEPRRLPEEGTPGKSPPTAISHPRVLEYENPKSSDSSGSHSPTERLHPTSEDDHPPAEENGVDSPPRKEEEGKETERSSTEGSSDSEASSPSPLPPGSRDSGFASLPRGSLPPKAHRTPPGGGGTQVSNGTTNSDHPSPEEAEHASKLANKILEEAKHEIDSGHA